MTNAQGPGLCSTSVDKKDNHVCSVLVQVVCCNLIRIFFPLPPPRSTPTLLPPPPAITTRHRWCQTPSSMMSSLLLFGRCRRQTLPPPSDAPASAAIEPRLHCPLPSPLTAWCYSLPYWKDILPEVATNKNNK